MVSQLSWLDFQGLGGMKFRSALALLAQDAHPNKKISPKMNFVGLWNILKPPAKSMFRPDCSQEPVGNVPMLENWTTIKLWKVVGIPTVILGPVQGLLELGHFGPGCPWVADGAHGPHGSKLNNYVAINLILCNNSSCKSLQADCQEKLDSKCDNSEFNFILNLASKTSEKW